ncbi:helix-turn-helix domain-containing protein [Cryptosporangium phraense]|uniref:Helix-turn-helix transcriptional regulator n=1 Tax=Cryptosporangium phraense TaxID=2593070 RepID=A0A545ASA1_9ACTN|nr:helix-turn-helix transcriptional regulator [Cryptosporangium phraense]TQS44204.1 helix-turn-helix transcriptional regulator [Cryptosporangium phraense]
MDDDLPRMPGMREAALRRRRETAGALADQRRAAGLSQTEVAARMGTSQSSVARLEAGEVDPRMSTLDRYAEALGGRLDVSLRFEPGHSAGRPFASPVRPFPGVVAPGFRPDPGVGAGPDAAPVRPAAAHLPTSPVAGDSPTPRNPNDRRW